MVLSSSKRHKLQRFIQNRSSPRNFKGYFTEPCSLSRVLSTLVMGEKNLASLVAAGTQHAYQP